MDETMALFKQNGGHSNLNRLLLLLFLAGLQPLPSSAGHQPRLNTNELSLSFIGPDYVTVGVPSSVGCLSNCLACTYSMSLGGQSTQGQGNVLAFTVNSWMEALTVTCTVTDNRTDATATVTKKLQVLAGPANVSITGPDLVNETMSYSYSCHASCRPSCSYAWKTAKGRWTGGEGNVMSITPRMMNSPTVLICKATNTVSGLFVSAVQKITVIRSASALSTRPEETLAMLLLTFISSAAFIL